MRTALRILCLLAVAGSALSPGGKAACSGGASTVSAPCGKPRDYATAYHDRLSGCTGWTCGCAVCPWLERLIWLRADEVDHGSAVSDTDAASSRGRYSGVSADLAQERIARNRVATHEIGAAIVPFAFEEAIKVGVIDLSCNAKFDVAWWQPELKPVRHASEGDGFLAGAKGFTGRSDRAFSNRTSLLFGSMAKFAANGHDYVFKVGNVLSHGVGLAFSCRF
ncbi:MAG: hypothetical protein ACI4Q3_10715 [Kiritimatiellia bacterium]